MFVVNYRTQMWLEHFLLNLTRQGAYGNASSCVSLYHRLIRTQW